MRARVTLLVGLLGASCSPPVASSPELRLAAADADGVLVPGEQLDLGVFSADCDATVAVELRDVGGRPAKGTVATSPGAVSVSPSSFELEALGALQLALLVARAAEDERDPVITSELVVSTDARALRFPLRALRVISDADYPSRLDFGGIQLGTHVTKGSLELGGLEPPFAMTAAGAAFSPSTPGHFEQRASIIRRPGCRQPTLRVLGDGVTEQLSGPPSVELVSTVGRATTTELVVKNLAMLEAEVALQPGDAGVVLLGTSATPASRDADGGLVAGELSIVLGFSPTAPTRAGAALRVTSGAHALEIPVTGVGQP